MQRSDIKQWCGFYNIEVIYVLYDAVYYHNKTYVCMKNALTAGIPLDNAEYWQVMICPQ